MRLNILCGTMMLILLTAGCSLTYRAGIYPIPADLKVKEAQEKGSLFQLRVKQ